MLVEYLTKLGYGVAVYVCGDDCRGKRVIRVDSVCFTVLYVIGDTVKNYRFGRDGRVEYLVGNSV